MRAPRWFGTIIWCGLIVLAAALNAAAGEKLMIGTPSRLPEKKGDNQVTHRCLTPEIENLLKTRTQLGLSPDRSRPWALPSQSLASGQQATINILVLRYNFKYETVDNPNTTGRGRMNFSNPLSSPAESTAYYDSAGHWIDPPPHNTPYFDAHMRALNAYWHQVSEGHLNLTWEIYPPVSDSAYQLPYPMSHYGRCDSVVIGLEDYFKDAIHLADSVHIIDPNQPDIDFSKYQAIFLVHAGSDRQNDIGFPPTCSDLFTGFIKFGDSVAVDNGTRFIRTALLVPETSCQDGRATALNAVLAHEFGHQLGLVDLYATDNFLSQLGDFSLMDDNGFGTGIDFGFRVGQVFGAIPVYPDAWSRAYLGLVPVVDFRQGTDIRVAAAEVSSSGIKIARVPISENEYYLIENRCQETDGRSTAVLADSATGVILYPVDIATKTPTGEYDNLLPGSGMLIYLVDEKVAGLDYDGDGQNNFEDNDLQNNPAEKFITLMEADGLVNFGGYYRAGFGSAEDMYREDRNHSFTPNTNPPAIDNHGNNTHVYITNITRDSVKAPGAKHATYLDTVMMFDAATEDLATGFPVRAGRPAYLFSPIVSDLNRDGADEVIVVSGRRVSVMTSQGQNFLLDVADTCTLCPRFGDSATASVHPGRVHLLPLFFYTSDTITANPVVGNYGDTALNLVAIGWQVSSADVGGQVRTAAPFDQDDDGQADAYGDPVFTVGAPIAMSFGKALWILTYEGYVYKKLAPFEAPVDTFHLTDATFDGLCRVGDNLVVMGGNETQTYFSYITDTVHELTVNGRYSWGPIQVDVNRDGTPEVVAASPDGNLLYLSIDTTSAVPSFHILAQIETHQTFTANPIAGDIEHDGYPDIIIGGVNHVYAFDGRGLLKTDFPIEISDKYLSDSVIAAPIQTEIANGQTPELIFPTQSGNIYSFGLSRTFGFPLAAGELGAGSPVVFRDTTGRHLGYQGLDGWFYAWDVSSDTTRNLWPMSGHDANGTFALTTEDLGPVQPSADDFQENQFFNYPNPVTNGRTAFRYTLGESASKVTVTVYDLTGQEIADLNGSTFMGENELPWSCGDITPGVYRCRIKVEFSGDTKTAFTDVAIIR